jgi:hypothetical protein
MKAVTGVRSDRGDVVRRSYPAIAGVNAPASPYGPTTREVLGLEEDRVGDPRLLRVEGELSDDALIDAFIARYPKARGNEGRWFLEEPVHQEGQLYQAKLAAHPGATADERMRLLAEARAEYEGPVGVQYFDTTFSVDKTISLAHASALASAVEARQAGDLQTAAKWEARAAGIWAEIEQSVRLYVNYMQGEAAFVRTGHHGRRIDGGCAYLLNSQAHAGTACAFTFWPARQARDLARCLRRSPAEARFSTHNRASK